MASCPRPRPPPPPPLLDDALRSPFSLLAGRFCGNPLTLHSQSSLSVSDGDLAGDEDIGQEFSYVPRDARGRVKGGLGEGGGESDSGTEFTFVPRRGAAAASAAASAGGDDGLPVGAEGLLARKREKEALAKETPWEATLRKERERKRARKKELKERRKASSALAEAEGSEGVSRESVVRSARCLLAERKGRGGEGEGHEHPKSRVSRPCQDTEEGGGGFESDPRVFRENRLVRWSRRCGCRHRPVSKSAFSVVVFLLIFVGPSLAKPQSGILRLANRSCATVVQESK